MNNDKEQERGMRNHFQDLVEEYGGYSAITGDAVECFSWFREGVSYAQSNAATGDAVAVPDGYVLMPSALTAENGAKYLFMGEFFEEIEIANPAYCGCGDSSCEVGEPETFDHKVSVGWDTIKLIYKKAVEHLASPTPPGSAGQHADDHAIDQFAKAMKVKMAKARSNGKSGWDDPEVCSEQFLANQLIAHIAKGNDETFQDMANFAMMLHQRGADPAILKAATDKPVARIPLNAETKAILGRPNFMCYQIANALRAMGFTIPKKSEEEQAAVIHYLLCKYLEHGDAWADEAQKELKAAAIKASEVQSER